jgi:hypothetical protein
MRTVILLSGIVIASALDKTTIYTEGGNENVVKFLATVMIVCMIMDVIEFIHKISK